MNEYKVPFVNFGAQYRAHKEEYDGAIQGCLNDGKLILQDKLATFEENLAKRLGMKYAVGVNSGTDALILALKAKEITGQKITTPGYTFKATYEAIHHTGNTPVPVDINFRLAPNVMLPVHIEGMTSFSKEAIIEDAAQAIAAKGIGYSGTISLSFYPAKILGGMGDGGAVVTDDKEVYEKVKLYRHHWQTDKNERYAYTARLDNVKAAFLDVKLKYLDSMLERRREIADKYADLVDYVDLPIYQTGRVWQDYVIRTKEPKKLVEYLASVGIQTLGAGLTPPHKALNLGGDLPETERLYAEMLRLPCNETLTDEQVDYVIHHVKEYFAK